MNERRKNDRLPFRHALMVRPLDSARGISAEACDLSASGMSFWTHEPLAIGDELRIQIAKVFEHASIAAEVRNVRADGVGYRIGVEHAAPA